MNRWSIWVEGIVQGVGFRPFVYELATRYQLTGSVRNEGDGVRIEVEGDPAAVEQFRADLSMHAPARRESSPLWRARFRSWVGVGLPSSRAATNQAA